MFLIKCLSFVGNYLVWISLERSEFLLIETDNFLGSTAVELLAKTLLMSPPRIGLFWCAVGTSRDR